MNVEDELMSLLANELAKEIDAEILKNAMSLSDKKYVRKEKIENLYSLYNSRHTT